MRHLLLILAAIFSSVTLFAQSGSLVINLDQNASRATDMAGARQKISAFRVCLFSDNSQMARGAANAAIGQLHSVAPGVSGEAIYENPFFKAYAGYCLNRLEATRLLGRLKNIFPRAIIASKTLPITCFVSYDQSPVDQIKHEAQLDQSLVDEGLNN